VAHEEAVQKTLTAIQSQMPRLFVYCQGVDSIFEPAMDMYNASKDFRDVFRAQYNKVKVTFLDAWASSLSPTLRNRKLEIAIEAFEDYKTAREPSVEKFRIAHERFMKELGAHLRRESGVVAIS